MIQVEQQRGDLPELQVRPGQGEWRGRGQGGQQPPLQRRRVQVAGLRERGPQPAPVEVPHDHRARPQRQDDRPGPGPDADRDPAGGAAQEGEGAAGRHDEAPPPQARHQGHRASEPRTKKIPRLVPRVAAAALAAQPAEDDGAGAAEGRPRPRPALHQPPRPPHEPHPQPHHPVPLPAGRAYKVQQTTDILITHPNIFLPSTKYFQAHVPAQLAIYAAARDAARREDAELQPGGGRAGRGQPPAARDAPRPRQPQPGPGGGPQQEQGVLPGAGRQAPVHLRSFNQTGQTTRTLLGIFLTVVMT